MGYRVYPVMQLSLGFLPGSSLLLECLDMFPVGGGRSQGNMAPFKYLCQPQNNPFSTYASLNCSKEN